VVNRTKTKAGGRLLELPSWVASMLQRRAVQDSVKKATGESADFQSNDSRIFPTELGIFGIRLTPAGTCAEHSAGQAMRVSLVIPSARQRPVSWTQQGFLPVRQRTNSGTPKSAKHRTPITDARSERPAPPCVSG